MGVQHQKVNIYSAFQSEWLAFEASNWPLKRKYEYSKEMIEFAACSPQSIQRLLQTSVVVADLKGCCRPQSCFVSFFNVCGLGVRVQGLGFRF